MTDKKSYLSLFVNISDKKIVVFGGGNVAERKVKHFLGSKHLVVVSRSLTEGLQILWEADQLDHINARLQIKDDVLINALIDKAFLVVPATSDRQLNAVIKSLADEKGILCNDVDQADDVLIPSQVHSEEASISITTYGSSPAMLKHLKERALEVVTPQMDAMIRIQGKVRNALKKSVADQETRRELLLKVLEDESIWELLPDNEDKALKLAKALVS
jgi:precorrin-2 dehydrogenase/sirohydrochlorin ferrochelatase